MGRREFLIALAQGFENGFLPQRIDEILSWLPNADDAFFVEDGSVWQREGFGDVRIITPFVVEDAVWNAHSGVLCLVDTDGSIWVSSNALSDAPDFTELYAPLWAD